MDLKLEIKKPKLWQPKWKIKKPTLFLLVYDDDGEWINTYWWKGNWRDNNIEFSGSSEVSIHIFNSLNHSKIKIVGNTGTNLIINNKRRIKGFRGDKPGWTVFGYLYMSRFTPLRPRELIQKLE